MDEFSEAWARVEASITEFKEAASADAPRWAEASAKLESLAKELDHDPIHVRAFETARLPIFSYLLHRITGGTALLASIAGVVAGLGVAGYVDGFGVRGALTYGIAVSAFLTLTDRARKRGLTTAGLPRIIGACIGLVVGVTTGAGVLWGWHKLSQPYNTFAMIDVPIIGFLLGIPIFIWVGVILGVVGKGAEGALFGTLYGALVALIAGGAQDFFPSWPELAVGCGTFAVAGGFLLAGDEGDVWAGIKLGGKMSFAYFAFIVPFIVWVSGWWRAPPASINEPISMAWWPGLAGGLGAILGAMGQPSYAHRLLFKRLRGRSAPQQAAEAVETPP